MILLSTDLFIAKKKVSYWQYRYLQMLNIYFLIFYHCNCKIKELRWEVRGVNNKSNNPSSIRGNIISRASNISFFNHFFFFILNNWLRGCLFRQSIHISSYFSTLMLIPKAGVEKIKINLQIEITNRTILYNLGIDLCCRNLFSLKRYYFSYFTIFSWRLLVLMLLVIQRSVKT